MHRETLARLAHPHDFVAHHEAGERRTLRVIALSTAMMVGEVVAGMALGSMALLADGWHMATHVAAFGITLFAYRYARRHAGNPRFSFGTGKVAVLGGFASAVALAVVALVMGLESALRVLRPAEIRYDEAIAVATLGLLVNLVCGALLRGRHEHAGQDHPHHHDHNLRAAYLHVLADALTSVLAIAALAAGRFFGWRWPDPVMGLVGALVIARWSLGLMRETGRLLLDAGADASVRDAIRHALEAGSDTRVSDLHVWHVGPRDLAAVVSVVTDDPRQPDHYRHLLSGVPGLSHVAVEVNRCGDGECRAGAFSTSRPAGEPSA